MVKIGGAKPREISESTSLLSVIFQKFYESFLKTMGDRNTIQNVGDEKQRRRITYYV